MSAFQKQQVEEAEQLARRMRALKWVVLVLGILLVLAMITTVVGVIYKARHNASASTNSSGGNSAVSTSGLGASGGAPTGFGNASLKLPAECQIASTSVSGDRLIIVTSGPADTCRLILVADLKTGKLIGQFGFQAP